MKRPSENWISDGLLFPYNVIKLFVLSETIVHAQGKLSAALVEGGASVAVGEALAVWTVLLVADVVDGEVDVQVVFFQRLPVGVDVVYAVAWFLAVYRALSAGDVGVFHALGVAAAPADFEFGVSTGKTGRSAIGGRCSRRWTSFRGLPLESGFRRSTFRRSDGGLT